MRKHNPDCDGGRCVSSRGEVRKLSVCDGTLAQLCRECYESEMNWRRTQNEMAGGRPLYDIVAWEVLPVLCPEPV
jgi:hypothetical protein